MGAKVVLLIAGLYLVVIAQLITQPIAQLMKTQNVRGGIIFKALPTLIGIACLVVALKMTGRL